MRTCSGTTSTQSRTTGDDLLAPDEFAINNAFQASIQDTPFYLNNGGHPRLPTDLNLGKDKLGSAKVCLQAAQQRQKKYADLKRVDLHFNVGDLVWLNSRHITLKAIGARKMLALWLGPFPVVAVVGSVNYILDIPDHYRIHRTFHVSMLRRAFDNGAGVHRIPLAHD